MIAAWCRYIFVTFATRMLRGNYTPAEFRLYPARIACQTGYVIFDCCFFSFIYFVTVSRENQLSQDVWTDLCLVYSINRSMIWPWFPITHGTLLPCITWRYQQNPGNIKAVTNTRSPEAKGGPSTSSLGPVGGLGSLKGNRSLEKIFVSYMYKIFMHFFT